MRRNFGKRGIGLALLAAVSVAASGCGNGSSGQLPGAVSMETPGAESGQGGQEGQDTAGEDGSLGVTEGGDTAAVAAGDESQGQTGSQGQAGNQGHAGSQGQTERPEQAASEAAVAVTDFGVRLLQKCVESQDAFPPYASMPQEISEEIGEGENILVSPLSVMSALAMTANGAGGETRAQMEAVFGMPVPEACAYLKSYRQQLPEADNYKLSMANAIWFTDDERFTVEQSFLEANEELFGASVYRVPFDDSTLREINSWVEENTDGMIEEIIDEIPADAVMYLVNALAFDAEWREIYHDYQVREGEFTGEDGRIQKTEFMYSEERQYLSDDHGEGFLKSYAEGKYAFAALLPEEGMTVSEYVASLNGDKINEILNNPVTAQVDAAIPKYESEFSIEMGNVLQELGMEDAFEDARADFSDMGYSTAGNLYVSRVLHKTFIAVDERGTKAGAATAVEIKDECAMEIQERRTVYLDRPFVYMIIDCQEKVPVFIGIVRQVGGSSS